MSTDRPSLFWLLLLVSLVGIVAIVATSAGNDNTDSSSSKTPELTSSQRVQTERATSTNTLEHLRLEKDATTEEPEPAAQSANCNIKGNIGFETREKIYHVPGQEYYEETKIDERYGERWFCSEQEAESAGWRKSKI